MDVIVAVPAERRLEIHEFVRHRVAFQVGTGEVPGRFRPVVLDVVERFERVRVEGDPARQFRQREIAVADSLGDDVRVVVRFLEQERLQTVAERRVSRREPALEVPLSGGLVGVAAEESISVGDAVAESERVEHRQPVEPVVNRRTAHLERAGTVPNQRAGQPVRHAFR